MILGLLLAATPLTTFAECDYYNSADGPCGWTGPTIVPERGTRLDIYQLGDGRVEIQEGRSLTEDDEIRVYDHSLFADDYDGTDFDDDYYYDE